MDEILRLHGAVIRDPAIDAWFEGRPGELGAIGRHWFDRMRESGDTRELVHDGCPVACVDDAPFAYVNVFKAHVNVGFFHGSELDDPAELLEGSGRRMRHVKVRPGVEFDSAALGELISAAYMHLWMRLQPWNR